MLYCIPQNFPEKPITQKLFDTPSHDNGFSRGEDTVGVATSQMPHPHQHRHCCWQTGCPLLAIICAWLNLASKLSHFKTKPWYFWAKKYITNHGITSEFRGSMDREDFSLNNELNQHIILSLCTPIVLFISTRQCWYASQKPLLSLAVA